MNQNATISNSPSLLSSVRKRKSTSIFENESSTLNEKPILFNEDAELTEAAAQNRMLPNKLTDFESEYFKDIVDSSPSVQQNFLFIRNKLLSIWINNPLLELTKAIAVKSVINISTDINLIEKVHKYLERYGYINYGFLKRYLPLKHVPKTVIIVGAGISGLIAASQLQSFGFNTILMEGHNQLGGRIRTVRFENNKYFAELGAMVIMGLVGNPLAIISQQLQMEFKNINMNCPLYDSNGVIIKKTRDSMIESKFNELLDASKFIANNVKDSVNLSLGSTLRFLMELFDLRAKQKLSSYLSNVISKQEKLKKICHTLESLDKMICSTRKLISGNIDNNKSKDFQLYTYYDIQWNKKLNNLIDEYDSTMKLRVKLQKRLNRLIADMPKEKFIEDEDKSILDWHFANLEFANSTQLENLSLKYWDQDDDYALNGDHLIVKNGYSCLVNALSSEITNILRKTIVNKIQYGKDLNGKVIVRTTHNGEAKNFMADACLCTVPLGVLKNNQIDFSPPLPDWKTEAINRLGFGILNKVVLLFENSFWDKNKHTFGHVEQLSYFRGDLFMFWTVYDSPTLIAIVSGEAAELIEKTSDKIVLQKTLNVLKLMFGSKVTEPIHYYVTRWGSDAFTKGSYSFVAKGASGEDYDILSKAVGENLFFAGEHTMRRYPASVHGALLSGMREAGKIADCLITENG